MRELPPMDVTNLRPVPVRECGTVKTALTAIRELACGLSGTPHHPQVLLVTGAASGIGAAIAHLAVAQGEKVMLADINADGVHGIASRLGENAAAVELDIRSPSAWEHALDATERHFGTLDVLVNNAAVVCTGYARDVPIEEHQRVLNTNFMGPVIGTLATLRRFRSRRRGQIVTVCSMTSLLPFPGIATYGAAKQALRAFHHAVALEERHEPIRFTIVHPTSTETPMLEQEADDNACGFCFLAKPVSPMFVAMTVLKAMRDQAVEVFMPPHQGLLARMVGTSPKLMRRLFDHYERAGQKAQRARRARAATQL